MSSSEIDLGHGVYMRKLCWEPDRELNPQYAHLEDEPWTGIVVGHFHGDKRCEGAVLFDTPANRHGNDGSRAVWQVQSWDPLTLSPSILMSPEKGGCGLHGFIREGRWVPA
ncbi:MAG TPA: DUF6527 family protein [Gemmatimonadales bacterium]|nr:DUF6527 family protein [Gemmatimonadales bacterium]